VTTPPRRSPLVLAVDDDVPVLDAVVADLRSRYGDRFRIAAAGSGADAVELLERAARRGDAVALVVADQRMPEVAGTDVLAVARRLHPRARAVLLTAYADTDAAITAINDISLDHYILKPWDPPEERLYPVIDELLEEWEATRPPLEPPVRVVGERWSAASHRLRDFLGRNLVPFGWIDVGRPEAARLLAAAGTTTLPLVVLEDGRTLPDPSIQELARTLALGVTSPVDFHDLVIVGAGPAGLAAAVYGSSEGLSTIVVEAEAPGGQAGSSSRIENYLGFPAGVAGSELARRALAQARRFGATVATPRRAVRVSRDDPYRVVELDDGGVLHAGAVVLATGVQYQHLDVPGSDGFVGAGLYYGAATTEAAATTGERVVIVGGANSAGQAALHIARFAAEVLVVVRGPSLAAKMSSYLVERIEASDRISTRVTTTVEELRGDEHVERVVLRGPGGAEEVDVSSVFVFIGARPRTSWLDGSVVTDPAGFVVTGPDLPADRWPLERDPYLLESSVPGVFAVGDVRASSVKRVASAVGEGSVAVQFVHQVLAGR
jgi:thioredoxin reductase (NADPH)